VVRMQVRVKTDGSLSVDKIIEGEPALADAATSAIRAMGGRGRGSWVTKKVDVITTVTLTSTPLRNWPGEWRVGGKACSCPGGS